MPLQPLDSPRLYQQVADQIGALIRAKEFGVGQRLPPERELAKSLGVSRPVVREAMIALELAGLVEVRTGSGSYVRGLVAKEGPIAVNLGDTGPSPFDIIQARMMFESEVAASAAQHATARELAEIASVHRSMCREAEKGLPTQESDRQFHVAIAAATHNSVLPTIVDSLWTSQFAPMFAALSNRTKLPHNISETIQAHGRIADALLQRNPSATRLAMQSHLQQVMDVLMGDVDVDADERPSVGVSA